MPDVPIHELSQKLHFIIHDAAPRRILGHAVSRKSLAEHLKVAVETLRDQSAAGVLSSEVQRALADGLQFLPNWPEWNDPVAALGRSGKPRRDTAAAFQARYLEKHVTGMFGKPISVERRRPWSVNDELATVQLSVKTQLAKSNECPIDVELACLPADVSGVRLAIRRCVVRVRCAAGVGPSLSERVNGRYGRVEIEGQGSKVLVVAGGPDESPLWQIERESGAIGGVLLEEICAFRNLQLSTIVDAQVSVNDKDFNMVAGDEAIVSGSTETRDPAAKPIGRARRQVLKKLAALSLRQVREQDSGSIVLCGHALDLHAEKTSSE